MNLLHKPLEFTLLNSIPFGLEGLHPAKMLFLEWVGEAQSNRFKCGMDTKAEREEETMEAAGVGKGADRERCKKAEQLTAK